MRKSLCYALALIFATTLTVRAAQPDSKSQSEPKSESMDCTEFDKPITTHNYISAPSDILHPHHLELTRPFAPDAKLKLHICRSDLRINIHPDAKEINLTINLNTESGSYTLADYIQTIRVTSPRQPTQP